MSCNMHTENAPPENRAHGAHFEKYVQASGANDATMSTLHYPRPPIWPNNSNG